MIRYMREIKIKNSRTLFGFNLRVF